MIPIHILQSPDNGLSLRWKEEGKVMEEPDSGQTYIVKEGVLQLLPTTKSLVHEKENAENSFHYADHYQQDATVFDYTDGWEDAGATHENKRLHQAILAKIPSKPKRVLDVGCGAAWVAAHFQGTETEVFSMDISTINPQKAVSNYPSVHHFGVVADAFHLPFQKGTFDAIIASEIIEHLGDPRGFLAGLPSILAAGGVLIVTTPHDEKIAYSLCIHCNQLTPHDAHLHSFTGKSIKEMLPKKLQAFASTYTFMNKLLLKARTHAFLKHIPFWFWKRVDGFFNLLLPKTARLMLVVRKPR